MFLRLCEKDLLLAMSSIRMIRRYQKMDVKFALIRDAIISYARPFSANRGRIIKKHELDGSFVPSNYKSLHDELIHFRDQVFAHTDIDAYDPKLVRWPAKAGYIYPMGFKGLSVEPFIDKLKNISILIRDVHHTIEAEEQVIQVQWLDKV